jgi:hypothetical protein
MKMKNERLHFRVSKDLKSLIDGHCERFSETQTQLITRLFLEFFGELKRKEAKEKGVSSTSTDSISTIRTSTDSTSTSSSSIDSTSTTISKKKGIKLEKPNFPSDSFQQFINEFPEWDSETFTEAWKMWIDERRERGIKKYTLRGELAGLKKLFLLASGNERTAIAIIQQSIEQGWQGLFELKGNGKQQPITTKGRLTREDFEGIVAKTKRLINGEDGMV